MRLDEKIERNLEFERDIDLLKEDIFGIKSKFDLLVQTCQRRQDSMKISVESLLKEVSEELNEINSKFLSITKKSEKINYDQIEKLNVRLTDFQEEVQYLHCNNMNNWQRLKERFEVSQKEEKCLKIWELTTFALGGLVVGLILRKFS